MEEIAVKQTMKEGSEEGEFDDTFRWKVDVKKVDILPIKDNTDFKPPADLFQVKINILWKSGLKERSTYIESYKTIRLEDVEKKS